LNIRCVHKQQKYQTVFTEHVLQIHNEVHWK